MLGSFSTCSNVTGVVTDTRRIAHEHGAFACFDFAAR
jgi:selenocysteine lyase/cysteine desulfurase